MIAMPADVRVWLANGHTDMRRGMPVSTGCSVARRATPFPFSSCTMSCRSFIDRASRSMRVTTSVSPGCTKSSSTCSSRANA